MAGVTISPAKKMEIDGWNASTLELYSHSGTHMDAPYHFEVTNKTIDEIDPKRFIVDAWVVNLSFIGAKEVIGSDHLGDIKERVQEGDGILLRTDWSKKLGTKAYRDELPRIGVELAQWLVEKKIGMLAVEPPSVADVNNMPEVTQIHNILLSGDVIIVEGLTNTDKITQEKIQLIAMPLKVKDGDGAPARVIAILK